MKQIVMHLAEAPFQAVASGAKKVEIRLNDAKRQMVQIGDAIVFILYSDNSVMLTRTVVAIEHFTSFADAYDKYEEEKQYNAHAFYTEAEIKDLKVVVFSLG